MSGTSHHFCCMMQSNQPHKPLSIHVIAVQWSQNHQTPIKIVNVPCDTPIAMGDIFHIIDLYGGDWIHVKVTNLTIMLQTCFVFEVSLTPIPLNKSTIFILAPINHAVRTKHMVAVTISSPCLPYLDRPHFFFMNPRCHNDIIMTSLPPMTSPLHHYDPISYPWPHFTPLWHHCQNTINTPWYHSCNLTCSYLVTW